MNSYLVFLIAFLVGTTIVVGGNNLDIGELLNQTKASVDAANLHQITMALEFYYLDHGEYPIADNGEQLIDLLKRGGYIDGRPLDASVFDYRADSNGQNYDLDI